MTHQTQQKPDYLEKPCTTHLKVLDKNYLKTKDIRKNSEPREVMNDTMANSG